MKYFYTILAGLSLVYLGLLNNEVSQKCPMIPKIENFKVEEYLGNWNEILHSKDFIWDYGCECIQANYTLDNSSLIVNNSCIRFGEEVNSIGKGVYQGYGKFLVSFGLFYAPYEVAYIDDDYETSIVISCINLPIFKPYVWLLSRHNKLYNQNLNFYLEKINNLGFKTDELIINKSC
jgi:lipocalin